ncbi:DUF1302 domain-containing protein [Stenotrophobium rhamnosiphilum]|uniref:DUF1302 domain-containing protein n=1 Tax=Stenotrophobium rhamnosiphilum TaxID=2029166 RepID=A0A2T5MBX3_9GAMM|nr:DUF1302 family protein [Stenotrophobium rhamnosiphilum]PTU30073.1 hypothetical protein CJD38_16125 [Stenotrophobium rhamnosiphilum]
MRTRIRRRDFAHQILGCAMAIGAVVLPCAAHAGSMELGDLKTEFKLTLNYGLGMRLKDPDERLINGPLDPFELHLEQAAAGAGFTHTGLSTTVNQDDGNRNFRKYDLTNNRLSTLAELHFSYENYGAVIAGDGFYDFVYHRGNANDSPDTVNKTGPHNEFSAGARRYDGGRARLLDAYLYGNWTINDDLLLDVRAGNQMVAWGESLFFPGVSSAQSTADATKAFTPGVEIKQILLPTPQVSFNLAIGTDWSVMGYYKFAFKPNEIFPVGDFLSPTDSVGPGAEFSYGSLNPLELKSCPGLLGPVDLCQLGFGLGGPIFNAPRTINIPYKGKLPTSRFGQYGLGLKYQVTPSTTLGFYALRYHDPNPSVKQHSGFPVIGDLAGVPLTTQVFNEPTPDYYQVKHFDGIRMLSTSFSTVLGPFNVAGEVSYRNGAAIAVQALELGTVNPVFSRGNTISAQTSAIYAANPHLWFDDLALVGEAGYLRVLSAEKFGAQPGIVPVGEGNTLFYDRTAYAFQLLAIPTKRNIVGGWDMSTPITFGWLVKGNPSIPGAFGALYGEGDMRLSVMANFQYLQNLQIGVGYNKFFGDPGKNIGDSFLKQNPYADRDNIAINIKYSI